MENPTIRKRCSSIHSETSATTQQSEELNEDQKKAILESYPTAAMADDAGDHDGNVREKDTNDRVREVRKEGGDGGVEDEDEDDLWGDKDQSTSSDEDMLFDDADPLSESSPVKKEPKHDLGQNDKTVISKNEEKEENSPFERAKSKLSKWAARLFDPDRPRGLIEPPRTIPLNDEFLQAFGKREKEMDASMGREIAIDNENLDEVEEDVKDDENRNKSLNNNTNVLGRKVKIANLAYTTTEATLIHACEQFGPIQECNLLMNEETASSNNPLNIGRAYVVFETVEAATACVEKLASLDGRSLRLSLASEKPTRKTSGGVGAAGGPARYWERDITTKCFRCGQVGHMEHNCPNERKSKPCPLCGDLGHDLWLCPNSKICFRCGVPGHINRECHFQQNLPQRMVCGICFRSGHHRVTCHERPTDAPSQDAKCMVCRRSGHFMCVEMKWFFGLEGVTCFNCGRRGHHGYDCDRPTLDQLSRDDTLAKKEIDRAKALSIADEAENMRQHSRNSNRIRGRGYDEHGQQSQASYGTNSGPRPSPRGGATMQRNSSGTRGYNVDSTYAARGGGGGGGYGHSSAGYHRQEENRSRQHYGDQSRQRGYR